jgi:hypothetical protein
MTFTSTCNRSSSLGALVPEEHVATHDAFTAGTVSIFFAACVGAAAKKKQQRAAA